MDKYETREFCGRDYQAFSLDHEINLEPVDEQEEERLQSQHELLKLLLSARSDSLLPDVVQQPETVLDCGYGTGAWAVDVAEANPDSSVVGIDICPIWVEQNDRPENFAPEIADLNDPREAFTFDNESFDFVNSRFVAAGLAERRWPSYITDIRRVLRPGGWIELIEWDVYFRAEGGDGDRLAALRQWSQAYKDGLVRGLGDARKSQNIPLGLDIMLQSSGFVNVSFETVDVPIGDWPHDENNKRIGILNRGIVEAMLTSSALLPIVGRGILSEPEFNQLIARCVIELDVPTTRPFIRLAVCRGQKVQT